MDLSGKVVGNYDVGPVLGRGGMSVVYRATSRAPGPAGDAGATVALKVFDEALVADERIFKRFEREAELGMRIENPHVVSTFEIGAHDVDGARVHFMAMELVEGQTLRDLLIELGSLPEQLVYQVADQALDALAAVHATGMVHRDVKPENLTLNRDQKLLLMDLGVARLQQEGRDLTRAGEFVGSIPYAAPEQFIDQDHVGPLADLYAFGVVLYEIATGRNPFHADDLTAMLQQKLKGAVRRPRLVQRDLDPFLDEVILTCLKHEPGERFDSCDELRSVLREGDAGAWWCGRIEGEAFPAAARALVQLRPERSLSLIGRATHLDRLHEAFEQAASGSGGSMLLAGAAGTGKSRLLHDFFEDLVAPDGPVLLAARCASGAARAHQPLLDALAGLAPDAARIRALVPELPAAADALEKVLAGDDAALDNDLLVGASTSLLRNLSSERPVVLALDDVHAAGPETLDLFAHLARATAGQRVLLLATVRPDAVTQGSPAHALLASGTETLQLGNFSRGEVDELLREMVRHERTVRALSLPLIMRSDGNPHVLLEMLAQLRADGAFEEQEDGLVLKAPLDELGLPSGIRALMEQRLEAVDDDLRGTLEAAAVAGPDFSATLVGAVTGQRRIGLLKQLAALERSHRLVESAGKRAFRFPGHGLHEVVYESIDPARRDALHRACATSIAEKIEELEGEGEPVPGDLAYALVRHLLKTGSARGDEYARHLPLAIAYVCGQLHPSVGTAFLPELIAAVDGLEIKFSASLELAELYGLLGRIPDQKRAFAKALALAERIDTDGARARMQAALAESSWRAGSYDRAETEASRAHRLACGAGDRRAEAASLHTLGTIAYRRGALDECMRYWRDALHVRKECGDRRGEAQTLAAMGMAMRETGENDEALAAKKQALEIVRETGHRRGEGAALNNLANALVDNHQLEEALVCYEQAIRIARDLGDMPGEAAALYNRGRALAVLARIEEAVENFDRALDLFRVMGDPRGEAETLDEMGSAIAVFGERERSMACLHEAHASARRTGDTMLLSRVLRHLANVEHEDGAHEQAWEHYDRSLSLGSPRGRLQTLADMGNAALREGKGDRAVELLEQGMETITSGSRAVLALCRLARAHKQMGRDGQAEACVFRAEQLIAERQTVSPQYAPEVYYSLGTVLDTEERGRRYLETAKDLLGARTRSIRSVVHRQHYLTMTWPNKEILEEARRLIEG